MHKRILNSLRKPILPRKFSLSLLLITIIGVSTITTIYLNRLYLFKLLYSKYIYMGNILTFKILTLILLIPAPFSAIYQNTFFETLEVKQYHANIEKFESEYRENHRELKESIPPFVYNRLDTYQKESFAMYIYAIPPHYWTESEVYKFLYKGHINNACRAISKRTLYDLKVSYPSLHNIRKLCQTNI